MHVNDPEQSSNSDASITGVLPPDVEIAVRMTVERVIEPSVEVRERSGKWRWVLILMGREVNVRVPEEIVKTGPDAVKASVISRIGLHSSLVLRDAGEMETVTSSSTANGWLSRVKVPLRSLRVKGEEEMDCAAFRPSRRVVQEVKLEKRQVESWCGREAVMKMGTEVTL